MSELAFFTQVLIMKELMAFPREIFNAGSDTPYHKAFSKIIVLFKFREWTK